jgi:adenylate cyclase
LIVRLHLYLLLFGVSTTIDFKGNDGNMTEHPERVQEALERLKRLLKTSGVTDDEIQQALANNSLDLLVIDRMILSSRRRLTEDELLQATHLDRDIARKFWRALGFPEVVPDERVFTTFDIEAASTIESVVRLGVADLERAIQLARVLGSSMARIAEAQVNMIEFDEGADDPVLRAELLAVGFEILLPSLVRLLEYAFRRHLQAAARRAWLRNEQSDSTSPTQALAVGFADMVGFTWISQQVSPQELVQIVSRFETVAYDTVVQHGGRVVKMIGDEAMFVTEEPLTAVEIALDLASAYSDDDVLSDVRIGLSYGEVLAFEGDYFGTVVNEASRIVNIANPGAILITKSVYDSIADSKDLIFRQLRPTYLKDIGRMDLWAVARSSQDLEELDKRRFGARWRKIADVLRDIEELKEQGQRLLSGINQPERSDPKTP